MSFSNQILTVPGSGVTSGFSVTESGTTLETSAGRAVVLGAAVVDFSPSASGTTLEMSACKVVLVGAAVVSLEAMMTGFEVFDLDLLIDVDL